MFLDFFLRKKHILSGSFLGFAHFNTPLKKYKRVPGSIPPISMVDFPLFLRENIISKSKWTWDDSPSPNFEKNEAGEFIEEFKDQIGHSDDRPLFVASHDWICLEMPPPRNDAPDH